MNSEQWKINKDYIAMVKKLPESRAINPEKSPTMEKLKLKLVTHVKLILSGNGSKWNFCKCTSSLLHL